MIAGGGDGVVTGDIPLCGLAGGLLKVNACVKTELAGLTWSAYGKLAIEFVGLREREPVGDARSDPVDMLKGGLSGRGWWLFCACAAAVAAATVWGLSRVYPPVLTARP